MPSDIPKEVSSNKIISKPFLKWAGGKTQLLAYIQDAFPAALKSGEPFTFVEPFVGSGAVLFWALRTFPNIQEAVINDINTDLTTAYSTIKNKPNDLIDTLKKIETDYFSNESEEKRKAFFLERRIEFNKRNSSDIKNTALLIFLNRTCFNGLYRVNKKNEFNVPFGRYKNPKICNDALILSNSEALQKVTILNGDYSETKKYINNNTFFYFDPPYKPISKTASFNAYSNEVFNDNEQIRLKEFCDELNTEKCKWILSNSDPKNIDPENNFFDDLYQPYEISRVKARRNINSKGNKRGEVFEILIKNFK